MVKVNIPTGSSRTQWFRSGATTGRWGSMRFYFGVGHNSDSVDVVKYINMDQMWSRVDDIREREFSNPKYQRHGTQIGSLNWLSSLKINRGRRVLELNPVIHTKCDGEIHVPPKSRSGQDMPDQSVSVYKADYRYVHQWDSDKLYSIYSVKHTTRMYNNKVYDVYCEMYIYTLTLPTGRKGGSTVFTLNLYAFAQNIADDTHCNYAKATTSYPSISKGIGSIEAVLSWVDERQSLFIDQMAEGTCKGVKRSSQIKYPGLVNNSLEGYQSYEVDALISGLHAQIASKMRWTDGVDPSSRRELAPSNNSLCYEAVQDLGTWANNGLSYIKELPEMGALATGFLDSLSKIPVVGRNVSITLDELHRLVGPDEYSRILRQTNSIVKSQYLKISAGALASAYLAYHYGIRLSAQDTKELYNYLNKDVAGRYRRLGATKVWHPTDDTTAVSRYHIYIDASRFLMNHLNNIIKTFDLEPRSANLWDMVPYSFVVDWFVKVGDTFNALDNYQTVNTSYFVQGVLRSDKYTHDFHVYIGDQEFVLNSSLYKRTVSRYPDAPIPSMDQLLSTGPATHWVEGAALVAQSLL